MNTQDRSTSSLPDQIPSKELSFGGIKSDGPSQKDPGLLKASEKPSIVDAPDRVTQLAGFAMLFGLGAFFAWAAYVPLAEGVIASGTVAIEGKRKTIQHLEGGIISAIYVREGDEVEAGDILIELDHLQSESQMSDLRARMATSLAMLSRLEAESQGIDNLRVWDARLEDIPNPEMVAHRKRQQLNEFEANYSQLIGQIAISRQRIEQFREQIAGLEVQREARAEELSLVEQDIRRTKRLVDRDLVDLSSLISLQRSKSTITAEIGKLRADIAIALGQITEVEEGILLARRDYRKVANDQISEVEERIYSMQEQMRVVADVIKRSDITAPQSGQILGLNAHTVGGVVSPAVPILELVPNNDSMLVEAQIEPLDIDRVKPGLEAEMRLSSFSSRTVPSLTGVVSRVSPDAVSERETGRTYYIAEIEVVDEEKDKLGNLDVVPGMPVEVMVLSGERTALEYLTKPISDVMRRSLSEE